ncbi:ankyrin repeat domain-containing protein 34C-like [Diadema antillarum]|uniref:ankyrin repeat domain-containing protein 34C-like n=1 Tax=Diadema antillarum TaxID=105358 RepID=UPI003A83E6D8
MTLCLHPLTAMTAVPTFEIGHAAASFAHVDGNALQKAVRLGKLRLTRLLVEGGTDIQSVDDDGRTALMIACMMRYENDEECVKKLKMVKFLLENKAKVDVQDKYGRTALMYACMEKAGKDAVALLLTYEADPRITDKNGSSALVYAVNARDSSVLALLVDACKTKGKEVIIITTNDRGQQRETKQYLNVPPAFDKSPPFYQCISPSQIEWNTSSNSLSVPGSTENLTAGSSSPTLHRRREKALLDSPRSPETSPRSPVTSPRTQRIQLSPGQSCLQNRRLVRRGSMGLLYESGTISPSRSHPDLPEESEEDAAREKSSELPVMQSVSSESLQRSPRTFRRPLLRRQSADAFNPSMLRAANAKIPNHVISATHSTPEKGVKGVSNRRCSLPGMPPPLKKSQTVHAINVPRSLLNNNKCPESTCDSENNSLTDIVSEATQRSSEGGKTMTLARRGSAPFLLEDELSYTRPGTLPPLNINPRPPIPDIGSTTVKPSPRLGRHADKRPVGAKVASHDRRFSIQVEDMRRLTNMYQHATDGVLLKSSIDSSGDSGAESS